MLRSGPAGLAHPAHNWRSALMAPTRIPHPLARQAPPHCQASAAHQQAGGQQHGRARVVGMGLCTWDYLALVAVFPQPDDKLRTERLELRGGGNAGNALTAAARLGLAPLLVSKVGDDSLAETILGELEGDGVDTHAVLRDASGPSPFTYIIIDRTGGTRTCIHTPGPVYRAADMSPEHAAGLLAGAHLVYFDGRLTEAALTVAATARRMGVPVLVEAERLRPHLHALLAQADFVVTSKQFPHDWTGEAALGDAMLATLARLPAARWLITTLGTRGSVMLRRSTPDDAPAASSQGQAVPLQAVIDRLFKQLHHGYGELDGRPACTSASGVAIKAGSVARERPCCLTCTSAQRGAAAQKAAAAAAAAAAANAEPSAAEAYRFPGDDNGSGGAICAEVFVATAAQVPQEAVVDTTGAGDAFIGATLFAICQGLPPERMLPLAAAVAACKCTALGSRPALPHLDQLDPALYQQAAQDVSLVQ